MAETWQVMAAGVVPAANKSMLGIINAAGTSKVIRVYRIWIMNNYTAAAYTGVLSNVGIYQMTGLVVGTGAAVTPVKHDTASGALDANVGIFAGGTVSGEGNLLRWLAYSYDEPAVGGATADEFGMLVPVALYWDTGYADTRLQPITLRSDEGIHIKWITNVTVGTVDLMMEFTQASS